MLLLLDSTPMDVNETDADSDLQLPDIPVPSPTCKLRVFLYIVQALV